MNPQKNQEDSEIVKRAAIEWKLNQIIAQQADLKTFFGEKFENLEKQFSDHEDRIRLLEKTTTEMSARLTLWQILQTSFTAIVGTVAAILGKQP